MASRYVGRGIAVIFAAMLAACTTQLTAPPDVAREAPPTFPDALYRGLREAGRPVFRVDPASSLVVMEVRRSGTLAQFGHDHVVASHDVGGYIAPDDGRADLYVPLEALAVDEPDLRARAHLDTAPSASDIAGTRSNMLAKVLESKQYPYAFIALATTKASDAPSRLRVTITLHGTTRSLDEAVEVRTAPDGVYATGTLKIRLSDFGMTPFSTLGGALAIEDGISIRYSIHGIPLAAGDSRPM